MVGPGSSARVGLRDQAVIAGQLGRQPRDLTGVAVRCPYGYPAVAEAAPLLSEGCPNPTLLYVTCPELAAAISRVEAAGGVRAFRTACKDDPEVHRLLEEVTLVYRRRRANLLQDCQGQTSHDPRLGAGIGGPEDPRSASCLHAYAAALLAVFAGWLGPLGSEVVEAARKAWKRFLPPLEESWCTDRHCARSDKGKVRAAIDVGTISVRVLVADVSEDRPWSLMRRTEVTRLGEGLEPGGALDDTARSRTAEVVAGFVNQARLYGAERIVLAATSAARDARDGKRFVGALGAQHDVVAVVLTGRREAELTYLGVCLEVPGAPVVIDVGGGSTELTLRLPSGRIQAASLPLGASRATEKWVRSDPPTAEELRSVTWEAAQVLAKQGRTYGAAESRPDVSGGGGPGGQRPERQLVGVAGTVTTLAALAAGLERYDSEAVHLRSLSLEEVRGQCTRLAGLTINERATLPCVQAGRAPVIVAGATILLAAMETLGYDTLTVSERDLLDGLVMQGP